MKRFISTPAADSFSVTCITSTSKYAIKLRDTVVMQSWVTSCQNAVSTSWLKHPLLHFQCQMSWLVLLCSTFTTQLVVVCIHIVVKILECLLLQLHHTRCISCQRVMNIYQIYLQYLCLDLGPFYQSNAVASAMCNSLMYLFTGVLVWHGIGLVPSSSLSSKICSNHFLSSVMTDTNQRENCRPWLWPIYHVRSHNHVSKKWPVNNHHTFTPTCSMVHH